MTSEADQVSGASLRHDALFYDSAGAYTAGVLAFLQEGLARDHAAFVAVPAPNIELIRGSLDGLADRVEFADMRQLGRNPSRIIPAIQRYLDHHANRPVSYVGEPIWAGRTEPEIVEATRHEALLNEAFAQARVSILCPYNVAALDAVVVADAGRTHPHTVEAGSRRSSEHFAEPATVYAASAWPLPPAPAGADVMQLYPVDLAALRRIVRRHAVAAGIDAAGVHDLLLAVNEVVTNTFVHAGTGGTLRLWPEPPGLICEVQDAGHITDPLAGRYAPPLGAEGGRGLWLVNQLCDLVEVRSDERGTTIRMHAS